MGQGVRGLGHHITGGNGEENAEGKVFPVKWYSAVETDENCEKPLDMVLRVLLVVVSLLPCYHEI